MIAPILLLLALSSVSLAFPDHHHGHHGHHHHGDGGPHHGHDHHGHAHGCKLPRPGVCGVNLADRILGGNKTALNGYPWTALLIVQPKAGGSAVSFGCGGSLISDQYVLTAAHCFEELPPEFHVTKVRLGEWDLLSEEDCQDHLCSDKPIDLDIESHVVHEEYDGTEIHNDVALIRLAKPVTFTEYISPVCLPFSSELKNAPVAGKEFTVVGWGATERGQQAPGVFGSQYKLEVQVPGVDQEECKKNYPKLADSELCSGGEGGKDSCQGDSGGFLGAAESDGYWYQYGVVSWGRGCGRQGIPGIYARVTSYLGWIRKHMKHDHSGHAGHSEHSDHSEHSEHNEH